MQTKCITCKGRGFCNEKFCPIYQKASFLFKHIEAIDKEFSGSSPPSVFVGRFNYPNVNVGILTPPTKQDTWLYDAPKHWASKDFTQEQIIEFRSMLINSRFKSNIYNYKNTKFLDIAQEIAMAYKPVGMEIQLKKKPKVNFKFESIAMPTGPTANVERIRLEENPKIPLKIEKVTSDTDLKAAEGLKILYKKDIDENTLSKLLSIGTLGIIKNRKLVPTRWSITAVDDTLGKELIEQIKDYNVIDNHALCFDEYLGNFYLIFLFPEPFSYELFESYMPSSLWNPNKQITSATDYEDHYGRKNYAENCAGGYYATRLSVLEKLAKIKKQASILILRFVTDEYKLPLGVWVCREAVRKAILKLHFFDDKEKMIMYAKRLILKRFNYNIENLLNKSRLLKQTKLTQFI